MAIKFAKMILTPLPCSYWFSEVRAFVVEFEDERSSYISWVLVRVTEPEGLIKKGQCSQKAQERLANGFYSHTNPYS